MDLSWTQMGRLVSSFVKWAIIKLKFQTLIMATKIISAKIVLNIAKAALILLFA